MDNEFEAPSLTRTEITALMPYLSGKKIQPTPEAELTPPQFVTFNPP
jgi:hypothetical protein